MSNGIAHFPFDSNEGPDQNNVGSVGEEVE